MNFRQASHIIVYSVITIALLLSGVIMMQLGFWQLDKIQTEQKNYQQLSSLSAPMNQLSKFAFIRSNGELVDHSQGSFYQIKQPNKVGYAHFVVFKTPKFDDLLVLYDWTTTPKSSKPLPTTIEGKALPFHLLSKQKITTPAQQTWSKLFAHKLPEYFIVSSHYPNLSHFQILYKPRLSTHYNYAFQFFLMGIAIIILAGYLFYRKNYE